MTAKFEDMRRKRAAYRATHRGTKEMDIMIGRFAEARLSAMSEGELDLFERLLAMPDPMINDWLIDPARLADAGFADLVSEIRAFHGLAPSVVGPPA